jgi:hypothetical protein
MTLFPWEVVITFATDLSSRPELSWADGLSKVKKNCLGPAITFYGTVALSFVIPSEAEGSAVRRTFRGNAEFCPQTKIVISTEAYPDFLPRSTGRDHRCGFH